jgi:hypothetical protein
MEAGEHGRMSADVQVFDLRCCRWRTRASRAASSTALSLCRPNLIVTNVQFSEMIPPTLERKWTATVDASRCAVNASGYFDLGITRLKETGYEFDLREQFIWLKPSVKIEINFWADEAVERYWIENITPCKCAN